MGSFKAWISANRVLASVLAGGAVAVVAAGAISIAVLGGGGGSSSRDAASGDAPATTTTTTGKPSGTWGHSAGANATIAPGVVALTFDAPTAGQGRVQLDGPGNIVLEGTYTYSDDANWSVAIDSASGSVAGVDLPSVAASGTVASKSNAVTSDVTVPVAGQPRIVPAWDQSASVEVTYDAKAAATKQALVGDVSVSTSRGTNSLRGTGRLGEDDTYALAVSGGIDDFGTHTALSGDYRGVAAGSGPAHTWSISGRSASGTLPDAKVRDIAIDMSQRVPGVNGTATLMIAGLYPMDVWTGLSFVDGGNWTLFANGSSLEEFSNADPQISAQTGELRGTLASRGGTEDWNLRAPMTVVDEKVTVDGDIIIGGPFTFALEAHGASGTVLGSDVPVTFDGIVGTVSFDRGVVSGEINLAAAGESLIDMPEGWNSVAIIATNFHGVVGQGVKATKSVDYVMTNGDSRLVLSGSMDSSGAFSLTVGGEVTVATTPVPFGGSFQSVGTIVDGVALTQPRFRMIGDIANVVGGVAVGGGSNITAGQFGFSQGESLTSTATGGSFEATELSTDSLSTSASAPTSSGTFYFTLSSNSTWTLKTTVDFKDQNNWTATVVTTATDPWMTSPPWVAPGVTTLTIYPNQFSGTIVDSKGTVDWEVRAAGVDWTNTTTGIELVTDFSLGSSCPLSENCPSVTGLFFGMTNGAATFPDPIPDMTMEGAFLSDGTWFRFSAMPDDVTFHGISMHDTSFTMWKGERDDSFSSDLEMPDLSSLNGGFNAEFCGYFTIPIPNIYTVNTGGCTEWSQSGTVMAQTKPGGDVQAEESSDGVSIGNTSIDGWAWTDLTIKPETVMNGVDLLLDQNINELTATMHIPANLMKATGNANADATISATGWYSSGDFSLDSTIPVHMKSGGFTLDSVSVHIGKDGNSFSLGLGANATVSMGGNHFPVTAFIGVEAGGGSSEITVRVSAKGTASADPNGGFDTASLLPTGTFEPDYSSTIDGSFDAKQSKPLNDDPGFEKSQAPTNLMSNSDFESGASQNVFFNGDFESGNTGNVFNNGDMENTELLTNGDFESGSTSSWSTSTGFTPSIMTGTAPSQYQGTSYLNLWNQSANNQPSYNGLVQTVYQAPSAGATYHVSAWVKSNDSSNGTAVIWFAQQGTGGGCATQTSNADSYQTYTVTPTWQQVQFDVTGVSCKAWITLYLNVPTMGDTVQFDAVSITITNQTTPIQIPNTTPPSIYDPMDDITGISVYQSGSSYVSNATDYGNPAKSIRTSGTGAAWMFPTNSWGYVSGDFNTSFDLYWPSSSTRDAISFGFYMKGTIGSQSGYGLRLQSATGNNNDSGIWSISNGGESSRYGNGYGAMARSTWYRVNLVTVTSGTTTTVTTTVTKISDGSTWATWSVNLPSGNRDGSFGENHPCTSATASGEGHRIDNITINTASNYSQVPQATAPRYMLDRANAHSGLGYMAVNTQPTNWTSTWSTGESPQVGDVYSVTAWVRSRGSNISGTFEVFTDGGTYESSSQPIAATSSWQKVTVSLQIGQSGHTDLRWDIRNLSPSATELDIDDVVVQSGGKWWYNNSQTEGTIEYAAYNSGSNSDAAHGGIGSLVLGNRTSNTDGERFSITGIPPRSGATYSASAWFRTDSGTTVGNLCLNTSAGTTEWNCTAFTATTSWQQISVSLLVANTGHTSINLQVQISGNQNGKSVRVDDVTTTVTNADIPQEVDQNWAVMASSCDFTDISSQPFTKTAGVVQATDFGNGGNSLKTDGNGDGFIYNSGSYATATGDFDMSVDIYFPSDDPSNPSTTARDIANVGFFMSGTASAPVGYGFRLDTSDTTNNGFFSASSSTRTFIDTTTNWGPTGRDTWYRVKIRTSGSTATAEVVDLSNATTVGVQTVTLPSGNRSGSFGQIYDGAGSTKGSRWDNLQIFRGSPKTSSQVVMLDATKAHSGLAELQLNAGSATTTTYRTIPMSVAAGSTYTATAWVRANTGTISGTIALAGQSSNSSSFSATTTWQQVTVSTTMGSGTSNGLTLTFGDASPNTQLLIDDINVQIQGLSQQYPWIPAPDSGGSISQTVWNNAAAAHSGSNYMEVQPKFTASNFYKESAVAVAPGDLYTASFWVKSKSGANQAVSFALFQGMWGNGRWVDVTATGSWQQFFVTLPISSASPALLDTNFYLPNGAGVVQIDDVEIHKDTTWGLSQPSNVQANYYVDQDGGSAKGAGYARITTNGANAGILASQSATVNTGSGWSIEAYVRSTNTSTTVNGTLNLTATGANNSSQVASAPFTANGDWQYVTVDLAPNATYTSLTPSVILSSAGALDVDEIKVMPKVVVQSDPWQTSVGAGGSVSAVVYADSTNAHDSLGVMRVSKTGSNDSAIQHSISTAPAAGSKYVMTAWVRSVTGAAMDGQFTLYAQGGTQEYASAGFHTSSVWQMVTITLPVNNGGHTSMLAQMVMRTAGVEIWVDDIVVQPAIWVTGNANGTTVTARQMNDASLAQSGSGYESISKTGSGDGWIAENTPGSIANATTQTVQAYVRSADGSSVTGHVTLTGSGGSGTDTASTSFTATKDWKKVTVNVPITTTGRNNLQTQVFVDTQNKWLDVDSVVVGQSPLGDPDGVTTALPHPNYGYTYLWDDAFGVPGAHLWELTAQIQFVNGRPGLGVGGTMYHDPSKTTGVMTGTDWVKGDMTLNISRAEPCLAFDFDATGLNSGVKVNGGVFTTKQFSISMAPKGCQVGDHVVPAGAAFSFDAQFGDGSIHIDMSITKGDAGPEFHADMGVNNISLGGFVFNAMELKVDITTTSSSTHFLGDFQTPMGMFYADYTLIAKTGPPAGFTMDADVSVTNWALKSADFSVSSFNYHQTMDVYAGQCSSFSTSTSGNLTMKSKNYVFAGNLSMDCHGLQVFHLSYQYSKKGILYAFYIDYDGSKRVLAGGLQFDFDKRMSWKFIGIRRTRHPKFAIKIDFSMPIDNPSAGYLKLYGYISVSGGNGSVKCTFGSGGGDDGCSLHVHVNVFGGQTLDTSW